MFFHDIKKEKCYSSYCKLINKNEANYMLYCLCLLCFSWFNSEYLCDDFSMSRIYYKLSWCCTNMRLIAVINQAKTTKLHKTLRVIRVWLRWTETPPSISSTARDSFVHLHWKSERFSQACFDGGCGVSVVRRESGISRTLSRFVVALWWAARDERLASNGVCYFTLCVL